MGPVSCQARAILSGIGNYRAIHRPEVRVVWAVLVACASAGQREVSAHRLNRMGGGVGLGAGRCEKVVSPGGSPRRCSGGQTERGKDLGDHGGVKEGGDDR